MQCDRCSCVAKYPGNQRSDFGQIGVLFCKVVLVVFIFLFLGKDKMYIKSTNGRK